MFGTGRQALALGVMMLGVATSCGHAGGPDAETAGEGPAPPEDAHGATGLGAGDGLPQPPAPAFSFTLRDGVPAASLRQATTPAPATTLAEADVAGLLTRLPALAAAGEDVVAHALREASKPPPRTGDAVVTPFPAPPSAPPAAAVQVEKPGVLRHQPEGEVPLAPRVTLTFATPMVPVTSHAALAAGAVPARLTPAIPGSWRWVGTRTLWFDPVGRAPMATEFTVEVPAGVKDAAGQALAEGRRFTFHTPPPRVVGAEPSGEGVSREPTFRLRFDQRVDAASALGRLVVEVSGAEGVLGKLLGRPVAIRPLTEAERKVDRGAARGEPEEDGRTLTFRATEPLPTDATIAVTVPAGFPSAEGPRVTKGPQRFTFRTYGPFAVRRAQCGWGGACLPGQSFSLELTNPLDPEGFDPALVSVAPAIPGLEVNPNGSWINLEGVTRGKTRYTVTVRKGLRDAFGQTLERDQTFTWDVGPSEALLASGIDKPMVVLDPATAKRRLTVYTLNMPRIDVRLHKVTPADWGAWLAWQEGRWRHDEDTSAPPPPGREVFARTVSTDGPPEALHPVHIDLSPGLEGDLGHVVAVIAPTEGEVWERRRMTVATWVQSTRLGLDAFWDGEALVAWATRLADGTPAADVAIGFGADEGQARGGSTDARGLARLPLPAAGEGAQLLVARVGDDVAFLPARTSHWQSETGWHRDLAEDSLRWMIFDDRFLYRPGETVSLKGAVRLVEKGARGDLGLLPAGALTKLTWKAVDSRGHELGKGEASVSALGTFHLQLRLPATPALGTARIVLTGDAGRRGGSATHTFDIHEFRRPEFEVRATASEGPLFVDGAAAVSLEAGYFAGGPLAGAAVSWHARALKGHYAPPNCDDFTFGRWAPWWEPDEAEGSWDLPARSFIGRTDGAGRHVLGLDLGPGEPRRPVVVQAEATVSDVNRQSWSTTTSLLVHPSDTYVGLRTPRLFLEAGQPIEVQAIATDLDGHRREGIAVALRFARLAWKRQKSGQWREVEVDAEACEVRSAATPVTCRYAPRGGGRHRVRAQVRDAAGRPNESELTIWVPGEERPAGRALASEKVTLIPTRARWEVGETAELLVEAPFAPAKAVAVVVRGEISDAITLDLPKGSTTLRFEIAPWMVPGVAVRVQVNGSAERTPEPGQAVAEALPRRPAYASGSLALAVSTASRRLGVTVSPDAARLEPGGSTRVAVRVTDPAGQPVAGAEVALLAVDEAVLALSGRNHPDPVDFFYRVRDNRLQVAASRDAVMLASVAELLGLAPGAMPKGGAPGELRQMARGGGAPMPSPMAAMATEAAPEDGVAAPGEGGPPAGPIAVRSRFDALAVFAPEARTDAAGQVSVPVTLPDSLTRYRVVAVAFSGGQRFGKGESAVTARLPLMVRISAPRFLNFGDRFELPVTLQNQTDAPLPVQLVVRASNATIEGAPGRAITVPPNDRVEVRVPVAAAAPGTARLQVGAAAGRFADAAEVSLPVWTPATTEAFATYGELGAPDASGAPAASPSATRQPVRLPDGVIPSFGGLDVQTSSTQLQALTDAVVYLVTYPHGCAEQIASRLLALAALRDALAAFRAPGLPSAEALRGSVALDMKRLASLQAPNGGFGFWRRDGETWPYVSVHVAHALVRAQEKGFEVPGRMLAQVMSYLENIREHFRRDDYSADHRRTIEAYALYVRHRATKADPAAGAGLARRAAQLLDEGGGLEKVPLEVVGWLYPIFTAAQDGARLAAIRTHLNNRVSETAGAAHFVTSWRDGGHLILHSERRVDGLLLEGLLGDTPQSELIPKLVRGLLGHRKQGVWQSTQENAWVLLGLERYFAVFERDTPSFTARAWLAPATGAALFAGEHAFKGRTTERHVVEIPMAQLAALGGSADLTLAREGRGIMYYRIGMRYAPTALTLTAADHGFHVERTYEAVDDPADVTREPGGRWVFKAGARVRVRLLMHTEDRRYHVALVDPLPAGLEPLNPALVGTQQDTPETPERKDDGDAVGPRAWWWGPWYEHDNLRDERAEAFASYLPAGVWRYDYLARATTPGDFVVPPTKAEEMYAPETFGRAASDRVQVR
jgi:uncharacterized protein YfaS (alpha-2-macroglobulin family)